VRLGTLDTRARHAGTRGRGDAARHLGEGLWRGPMCLLDSCLLVVRLDTEGLHLRAGTWARWLGIGPTFVPVPIQTGWS
jgi:hypothetical protein